MFRYTLRDESNHIEVFRRLLLELVAENPGIWTPAFREELRELMREAVELEQRFIADCLPVEGVGLSAEDFSHYIDYIADRRLVGVGLEPLRDVALENPLPWLAELMDVRKEQNFFEGRVTEYQKAVVTGRRRRRGALGHGHRVRRDPAGPRAQARGGAAACRAAPLPELTDAPGVRVLERGRRRGAADRRARGRMVADALAVLALARGERGGRHRRRARDRRARSPPTVLARLRRRRDRHRARPVAPSSRRR